jgi:hypothetical protein
MKKIYNILFDSTVYGRDIGIGPKTTQSLFLGSCEVHNK